MINIWRLFINYEDVSALSHLFFFFFFFLYLLVRKLNTKARQHVSQLLDLLEIPSVLDNYLRCALQVDICKNREKEEREREGMFNFINPFLSFISTNRTPISMNLHLICYSMFENWLILTQKFPSFRFFFFFLFFSFFFFFFSLLINLYFEYCSYSSQKIKH